LKFGNVSFYGKPGNPEKNLGARRE